MTRRNLFAMFLGAASVPTALIASRRPGSWFVEQITLDRMHFAIMRNMSMCVDPPLLLRERGALRPFPYGRGL